MTDMCLRIDGLPHDTWGYTLLPFQGVLYRPHLSPGCRFALPWAMSRLPFQGVLYLCTYDHSARRSAYFF